MYSARKCLETSSLSKEAFESFCNADDPCSECLEEYSNNFYCSCCDVPSRVNHLIDGSYMIVNNRLHTCEGCGHTAHWACHRGNSMMDPVDVMELDMIRCVKCKTMIAAKHSQVNRISYDTRKSPEDAVFTRNLLANITESTAMNRGYFKTRKVSDVFEYIIKNIRSYDRIKTEVLDDIVLKKLTEFSSSWGNEKSRYYFSKIH